MVVDGLADYGRAEKKGEAKEKRASYTARMHQQCFAPPLLLRGVQQEGGIASVASCVCRWVLLAR